MSSTTSLGKQSAKRRSEAPAAPSPAEAAGAADDSLRAQARMARAVAPVMAQQRRRRAARLRLSAGAAAWAAAGRAHANPVCVDGARCGALRGDGAGAGRRGASAAVTREQCTWCCSGRGGGGDAAGEVGGAAPRVAPQPTQTARRCDATACARVAAGQQPLRTHRRVIRTARGERRGPGRSSRDSPVVQNVSASAPRRAFLPTHSSARTHRHGHLHRSCGARLHGCVQQPASLRWHRGVVACAPPARHIRRARGRHRCDAAARARGASPSAAGSLKTSPAPSNQEDDADARPALAAARRPLRRRRCVPCPQVASKPCHVDARTDASAVCFFG